MFKLKRGSLYYNKKFRAFIYLYNRLNISKTYIYYKTYTQIFILFLAYLEFFHLKPRNISFVIYILFTIMSHQYIK